MSQCQRLTRSEFGSVLEQAMSLKDMNLSLNCKADRQIGAVKTGRSGNGPSAWVAVKQRWMRVTWGNFQAHLFLLVQNKVNKPGPLPGFLSLASALLCYVGALRWQWKHLYKKAGKDGQKIAGHASEGMTKNYQRDREEIIWSEAIPDLNISEITG
jgi:hypothetical protein